MITTVLKQRITFLILTLLIIFLASCNLFDKENDKDAVAHYNLGVVYVKSGRYPEATEEFKEAIRIKPDYADAHFNLGLAYRKLGKYREAIEAYGQAIRIKPDYAIAYYNLGVAYLNLNDRGSALEEYKILKELDTELANMLFRQIHE